MSKYSTAQLQTSLRLRTAAFASATALLLSGCGAIVENALEEGVERAIESESGEDIEVDFDGDGSEISITGSDGEELNISVDEDGETSTVSGVDDEGNEVEFTTGVDLPDTWPDDLPIPEGEVLSASSIDGGEGNFILSISMSVEDVTEANNAYLAALEDAGFTSSGSTSQTVDDLTTIFTGMESAEWNGIVTATEDGETKTLNAAFETQP